MKILLISDNYVPLVDNKRYGGAESVLMEMATALKTQGHQVSIMAPKDSSLTGFELIPIKTESKQFYQSQGLTPPRGLNWDVCEKLKEVKDNFDLIINHHKQPFVINWLANNCKKPCISIAHNLVSLGGIAGIQTYEAYKRQREARHLVLTVSGFAYEMGNATVPGSVDDYMTFMIAHERFRVRKDNGRPIQIGAFAPNKATNVGPWVFNQLPQGGDVVGYVFNGQEDYFNSFKEVFEKNSKVVWHNGIPYSEVMELLSTSKVLIQPNAMESASAVCFEASVRGVPSIIFTKGKGHGAITGSFLTNAFYVEYNSYNKRLFNRVINEVSALIESINFSIDQRQALADHIYDNYNLNKYLTRLNKFIDKAVAAF